MHESARRSAGPSSNTSLLRAACCGPGEKGATRRHRAWTTLCFMKIYDWPDWSVASETSKLMALTKFLGSSAIVPPSIRPMPRPPSCGVQWRTQKALLLTGRTVALTTDPHLSSGSSPGGLRDPVRGLSLLCLHWVGRVGRPSGTPRSVSLSVLKSLLLTCHCVCVPWRLCASARGAQPPSGSERAGLLTPTTGLAGGGRLLPLRLCPDGSDWTASPSLWGTRVCVCR